MKSSLMVILLLLVVISSRAQILDEFQSAVHSSEHGQLKYRVLIPSNFDTAQNYPVVLFLHGAGERGSDNQKQLVHGSQLFVDNRQDFPAIVIFPQCAKDDYWSNVEKKTIDGQRELYFSYDAPPTKAMAMVLDLMDSVVALSHTADDRLYVGGLSMGGMGTFEILWRRPDMFAAAVAICGGGDVDEIEDYDKSVNLWVFHGAKDDVVQPKYSKKMIEALRKHGSEVKFSLYPGANHNSWDSAFAEPDLLPWLFSHSK